MYNSSKSTSLNYIGIEPLPILANFSKYLHENKNFEVVDSFEKISPSQREINFCYIYFRYMYIYIRYNIFDIIDYILDIIYYVHHIWYIVYSILGNINL